MDPNPNMSQFSMMDMDGFGGSTQVSEISEPRPAVEHELEILSTSKTAWLQEVMYFGTKLVIILVTVAVATIAIFVKANWFEVILRSGVTVLVLGFMGWIVNWLFGKFLLEAKFEEMKEQTSEINTIEVNA